MLFSILYICIKNDLSDALADADFSPMIYDICDRPIGKSESINPITESRFVVPIFTRILRVILSEELFGKPQLPPTVLLAKVSQHSFVCF